MSIMKNSHRNIFTHGYYCGLIVPSMQTCPLPAQHYDLCVMGYLLSPVPPKCSCRGGVSGVRTEASFARIAAPPVAAISRFLHRGCNAHVASRRTHGTRYWRRILRACRARSRSRFTTYTCVPSHIRFTSSHSYCICIGNFRHFYSSILSQSASCFLELCLRHTWTQTSGRFPSGPELNRSK